MECRLSNHTVVDPPFVKTERALVEEMSKRELDPLNLKSDVLGDSVILNHVLRQVRVHVTKSTLAKLLNKDLSYVEKMVDGQEVLFNGATYVVKGD